MTLTSGSGGVNYNTFTAGGMGSGMGYPEGEEENNEEEEKPWYLDHDNDGYHSEIRISKDKPLGGNWISTTNGEDCDDTESSLTTDCSCETKCLLVKSDKTGKSKLTKRTAKDIDVSDCECEEEDDNEEDLRIFNELTGKALCVYDKLENLNLFKETIKKFDDIDSYNLIFTQEGDCNNQAGAEACTNFDGDKTITIKLLNTNQPELDLAATILHEGIHADIFKFVNESENGQVDPNDRPRLLQLFFYYKGLSTTKDIEPKNLNSIYQHEYMAEKYITPIANAIRKLDGSRLDIDYYYWYAWEGLENTFSFTSQLTKDKKLEYQRNKAYINSTTNVKCE